MKLYTKGGDQGKTSLMNNIRVSKYDDRVELLGTIDELNSQIGMAKVIATTPLHDLLSQIQRDLMQLMAGIADPRNLDYKFNQEKITVLEEEIDRLESAFPRAKEFVLYGGCEQSARLDVARAVTRRAERRFAKVAQNYGADFNAMKYLNRLSDFLYIQARYADHLVDNDSNENLRQEIIKKVIEQMKQ